MLSRSILIALTFVSSIPSVRSTFTYQFGNPTQCDPLNLTWTGGQAPFELLLIPVFGTPRTIQVPGSAFSNGKGSLSPQIPFAQNRQMMIVMSDATGFATGGVSVLTRVGASVGGNSCNTTDSTVPFSYQLNTALTQCRPYTFSGYDGASDPVTITGLIPGGDTFVLHPPGGGSSYDWIANLAAGTSVVFTMTDSTGRTGGSSDVKITGASDDSSCLNSASPVSTSNAPSPTTTTTTTPAPSAPAPAPPGGNNNVTIVLTVIGGVVAVAIVISLVVFLLRRRAQMRRSGYYDGGIPFRGNRGSRIRSMDLTEQPQDTPPEAPRVTPFSYAGSTVSTEHSHIELPAPSEPYPFTTAQSQLQESTTGQTKASLAGLRDYNKPQRFILHTDVDDAVPNDQDDELVELPPTYSERRAPPPQFIEASPSHPGSSPSTTQPEPPLSFDRRQEHSYYP